MKVGDFVECEGVEGRIVSVEDDFCLVHTLSGIFKLKKEKIKVTLPVEEHIKMVQAELEKDDWHRRMHEEVVSYFDMRKPLEPQVEKHVKKLVEWIEKNPPPKEE